MATFLGWVLLIGGIAGIVWVVRTRAAAIAAAGRSGAPSAPTTGQYVGVIAALVVGLWLIASGSGAMAGMNVTHSWDFGQDPQWLISNTDAIHWDQGSGALKVRLESGSANYGVAPVDWDANRFRAEFDIRLDSLNSDKAVVGVGLFDGTLSNIEDRDHVGGSTIQASFGRDTRLLVSDTNLLSRRDAITERGDLTQKPIQLQPGQTYHAVLAYNRRDDTATLTVTPQGSSQPLVQLKVEELKDFTPNVAYFGVSIRGYNKGKDDNPKPAAVATLDNIQFSQP